MSRDPLTHLLRLNRVAQSYCAAQKPQIPLLRVWHWCKQSTAYLGLAWNLKSAKWLRRCAKSLTVTRHFYDHNMPVTLSWHLASICSGTAGFKFRVPLQTELIYSHND